MFFFLEFSLRFPYLIEGRGFFSSPSFNKEIFHEVVMLSAWSFDPFSHLHYTFP